MRRRIVGVVVGAWLAVALLAPAAVAQQQGSQADNAKQASQGFAGMVRGLAGAVTDFANGPNGQWLGYLVLIVIGLWVARRVGIMRS